VRLLTLEAIELRLLTLEAIERFDADRWLSINAACVFPRRKQSLRVVGRTDHDRFAAGVRHDHERSATD
jgi:hypothetical protein